MFNFHHLAFEKPCKVNLGQIVIFLEETEKIIHWLRVISVNSLLFSRELRNLRVVRVELDSGKRLVGLRYPHVLISDAEQYLTEQKCTGNTASVSFFSFLLFVILGKIDITD